MTGSEGARHRETSGAAGVSGVLAERWEIDGSAPLPAFDRRGARAFACHDRTAPGRPSMALLTSTELPFRVGAARALCRRRPKGLLTLQHFGSYRPDPGQPARIAFVYDRPPSGAVPLSTPAGALGGREIEPWRRLLNRAVPMLEALAAIRVVHRSIRPDNLWFVDGSEADISLGDGVSSPAGFDQPAAFEPIDRAMATPAGRGDGVPADDLFALGVTTLALATGEEPGRRRSHEDLLEARLLKGSYAALTEGLRVPVPLVEVLRGMLADAPGDRWTLRDLQTWLDGGRPRPRLPRPRQSPEAPFLFAGGSFQELRSLARALGRDAPEATRALRGGGLATWARYALRDPALSKRLEDLAEAPVPRGAAGSADDALVARAALLLDSGGPVRYRGASFVPDGFGAALADAMVVDGTGQAFAEAILLELPAFRRWAHRDRAEADGSPDGSQFAPKLRDPRPGFGLERCLYEANPGLRCLSPIVRDAAVYRLRDLLPALEEAARVAGRTKRPMDRHLAAFIAAHDGRDADVIVPGLADPDAGTSAAAMLALLALVQSRYAAEPVPHLAGWVGESMAPMLDSVRRRVSKEALKKELQRELRTGDLSRLQALLADPERQRKDQEGFAAARSYWRRAEGEIRRLESTEPERQRRSRARGRRIATIIAVSTAVVSVGLALSKFVR